MKYFFFQKTSCHLLVETGLYKEALDLSVSLEMWDDVIMCYTRLGRKEKVSTKKNMEY